MNEIRAMIVFATLGLLTTLVCLIKTTPLTMTAFFAIGLPCFGLGILAYLVLGLRLIKAKYGRRW